MNTKVKKPKKPYRYLFLIRRMDDHTLYNPSLAAELLTEADIQEQNLKRRAGFGGYRNLAEAREVARASITNTVRGRITVNPSGYVASRNSNKKLHPAHTGDIWKSAFDVDGYQGLQRNKHDASGANQ